MARPVVALIFLAGSCTGTVDGGNSDASVTSARSVAPVAPAGAVTAPPSVVTMTVFDTEVPSECDQLVAIEVPASVAADWVWEGLLPLDPKLVGVDVYKAPTQSLSWSVGNVFGILGRCFVTTELIKPAVDGGAIAYLELADGGLFSVTEFDGQGAFSFEELTERDPLKLAGRDWSRPAVDRRLVLASTRSYQDADVLVVAFYDDVKKGD